MYKYWNLAELLSFNPFSQTSLDHIGQGFFSIQHENFIEETAIENTYCPTWVSTKFLYIYI